MVCGGDTDDVSSSEDRDGLAGKGQRYAGPIRPMEVLVINEDGLARLDAAQEMDVFRGCSGKIFGFSHTTCRILKLPGIHTVHTTWAMPNESEKAAMLTNYGAGVGSTFMELAPLEENAWTTSGECGRDGVLRSQVEN